ASGRRHAGHAGQLLQPVAGRARRRRRPGRRLRPRRRARGGLPPVPPAGHPHAADRVLVAGRAGRPVRCGAPRARRAVRAAPAGPVAPAQQPGRQPGAGRARGHGSRGVRALVVGGGPAGTTAAIALARAGIDALVLEREQTDRPVGIGLALQNSPLRALHALGLLDAVVERGYRHEAVNICAPDGTVVHRVVTEPLVPGTPSFVAISRVALAGILGAALAETRGAEIRY